VDLLLEKNPDAELSEVMGREMKRIDALLSQTLRVANPPKPRVAAVHVHEVLDHSLRLVQHQINEKLVSLQRRFDATSDVVNGDGYQLEQSFMNLMLNALEAMGANGELTIATEIVPAPGKNSAQLAISIRDTGIGVAPENMERLFETFFTTKQNGTGLGLAITRRIIHEHDGEITAQSQVHKGTTFRITLPLA
jgi:signal transduction histidine kinase